jgi:hypothetical protein
LGSKASSKGDGTNNPKAIGIRLLRLNYRAHPMNPMNMSASPAATISIIDSK